MKAVVDGITIIDDFAHHPTAIRETLRALRSSYPGARLWAVLEPRSNTLRRNIFERELVEALGLADEIVLPESSSRRVFLRQNGFIRRRF